MHLRATCNSCGEDFLFLQLYSTSGRDTRCPHCRIDLGITGARHFALLADRAAAGLIRALRAIAARKPAFTLRTDSVLDDIQEAVRELGHEPCDPPDTAEQRCGASAERRPSNGPGGRSCRRNRSLLDHTA